MRTTNIDDLLGAVPEFVARTLRADIAVLYWAAPGAPPHPRVIHGIPEELAGDAGVAAAILADGAEDEPTAKPRIVNDYRHGHETGPALVHVLDVASGLRVPLIGRKGLLGLLVTHARNVGRFGEEELHFMQAVGNLIVEALMRGDVEAQLAHAQRLESIGQLTGGIAHDFNNILTVVLGNLQMLHETLEESGGDRYIKLVESAQRAARRGADLTHKLLTFSRKQSLAPGGIDPAAALSALAEMLQRTIGDSIVIETVVAPGCPLFRADGPQFDNAVVNLALNARDAMPEGGHLRLTAAMVQVAPGLPDVGTELSPGSYVVIGVADTGQGMSPEVLRRACEPFFTTKASDKGSGLGLSMVYGFAKQSGGAIRIRSAPGQGTEVGLFFPVAAEAGAGASERPPGAGGPGKPTRQATILVVDDDVEVLGVATGFLEKAGYRVLQATDSAGARRWLTSQEPIAMLFTDVVLGPHETGPGLAAEAEQIRPGLPVLFTSGFAQGALGIVQMKPAQFLAKPYQHDQLAARIAALLAQADGEPAQPPAPARPNTLHLPTGHL